MDPLDEDGFARRRLQFHEMVGFLGDDSAAEFDHAALEAHLDVAGRELLRRLYQDHLDLRASREQRLEEVVDATAVESLRR